MRHETEYCCEITDTGHTHWSKFTEHHAQELRTIFEEGKGLRREDALELVNKWNRMNRGYRYFLHP